jgi:hypothetical protein
MWKNLVQPDWPQITPTQKNMAHTLCMLGNLGLSLSLTHTSVSLTHTLLSLSHTHTLLSLSHTHTHISLSHTHTRTHTHTSLSLSYTHTHTLRICYVSCFCTATMVLQTRLNIYMYIAVFLWFSSIRVTFFFFVETIQIGTTSHISVQTYKWSVNKHAWKCVLIDVHTLSWIRYVKIE